ncbi:hypothetical protein BV25DRAFT_334514 [Artomyces pyxidatus]|uniref:Uncharacterized protein n=1 Tax=Artomyces pyxidatus TaxID=48021 RepID=A0ACB8T5K5_9AGAM|nr:hypothetical protein BV25DRAFT_334514 [Artomyces pyxidatus]
MSLSPIDLPTGYNDASHGSAPRQNLQGCLRKQGLPPLSGAGIARQGQVAFYGQLEQDYPKMKLSCDIESPGELVVTYILPGPNPRNAAGRSTRKARRLLCFSRSAVANDTRDTAELPQSYGPIWICSGSLVLTPTSMPTSKLSILCKIC